MKIVPEDFDMLGEVDFGHERIIVKGTHTSARRSMRRFSIGLYELYYSVPTRGSLVMAIAREDDDKIQNVLEWQFLIFRGSFKACLDVANAQWGYQDG